MKTSTQRRVLLAFSGSLALLHAAAQVQLLADINQVAVEATDPLWITDFNGVAIFTMEDDPYGTELWRSDGTDAGTYMLKDIRPGSDDGLRMAEQQTGTQGLRGGGGGNDLEPRFTVVGATVYFVANDGVHGRELWATDGTAAGTRLVKDIFPGSASALFQKKQAFIPLNGILYFFARNGVEGLWRSDGTTSGTYVVKDMPGGSIDEDLEDLAVLANVIYFPANDGTTGRELWRSDGSTAGTMLVLDACPGPCNASPNELVVMGTAIYYNSSDPISGEELWKSDGTAGGTLPVGDLDPGAASFDPRQKTVADGMLYFLGNDGVNGIELWGSDGTLAGTELLIDITPGPASTFSLDMAPLPTGDLLFSCNASVEGKELWISNGTMAGTSLLKDIHPGGDSDPNNLSSHVGQVWFSANDGSNGYELWASDGTAVGTQLMADIEPGTGSGYTDIEAAMELDGELYFSGYNSAGGNELWSSDGTPAGTQLVKDLKPGSSGGSPEGFAKVGGSLFFAAYDPANYNSELWVSDGSEAGTVMVEEPPTDNQGSQTSPFTEVAGITYFMADDGVHGTELWSSMGTPASTGMVKDVDPTTFSFGTILGGAGGQVVFSSYTPTAGYELWISDGTDPGTVLLSEIEPGPIGSDPYNGVQLASSLLFSAYTSANGRELWASDGTVAGTSLVLDIEPGPSSSSLELLGTVSGVAVFSAFTLASGQELWRSDGTLAGTYMITAYLDDYAYPIGLNSVDGFFYFSSYIGGYRDIWRTDGTVAGTGPVDLMDQFNGAVTDLVKYGADLYFIATTEPFGNNDHELWRSDGTVGGTAVVADLGLGTLDGARGPIALYDNLIYFTGYDVNGGWELFRSDGTQAGTFMVADIEPGPADGNPAGLVTHAGTLYFKTYDGDSNYSLWRSDGDAASTIRITGPPDLSLQSALFPATTGLYFKAFQAGIGAELFTYDRPATIRLKARLEGPYDQNTGMMRDNLRTAGLIPLSEPYSALGFLQVGSGGESIDAAVLAVTGTNAIVDWVRVELRSNSEPGVITHSANALIQRDGDIVGLNGTSFLELGTPGFSHIAVRHRNHLGVMTADPLLLTATGTIPLIDFSLGATPCYGTNPRKTVGSVRLLWAGNTTRNGRVSYTGFANDRDPILVKIGGTTPNNTITGYHSEDVNLDGTVRYTGTANDRDPILVNIGSTVPTNVRLEQLP